MVCKIHKNIKSSLRKTIKGRDAQSTSNTILSCALEASTHLYPPLLSFPSLSVSHFLSTFPSFYSISSQAWFVLDCRFALFQIAPIPRWIVCFGPQAICGYQRQNLFPLEMFRGGEGKKEQAPFWCSFGTVPWMMELAAEGKQQQQHTTTEKPNSLIYSFTTLTLVI